jgi:hypothetical protein
LDVTWCAQGQFHVYWRKGGVLLTSARMPISISASLSSF